MKEERKSIEQMKNELSIERFLHAQFIKIGFVVGILMGLLGKPAYRMEGRDLKEIQIQIQVDKKELYAHLKQRLPRYMLPGLITAENALPLNQNGKIDRQVLKNRLREGL